MFLMLPAPFTSCAKKVVGKFCFNELKIEKVKFFTQSPTKIVCINIFNVGSGLKFCLTFRPSVTWLLMKKRVYFSHENLLLINLNAIFPFEICCNIGYKFFF